MPLLLVLAAAIVALLGFVVALSTPALAADDGVDGYTPADIILPFTKTWDDEDNADGSRPESLTITLYRYTGDSYTDADAFMTETISADTGWACEFDVTDDAFYQGTDGRYHAYRFAVEEETVEGYTETAREDPEVILTVSEGSEAWDRVEPNNQLTHELSTESYPMSFVVAKKGHTSFVWTPEELSPLEQHMLFAEIQTHPGFGGLSETNAEFLTGMGASTHGMTITPTSIDFEEHSNWSFYAVGSYTRSTPDEYAASITNTHEPVQPVSVSVSKVWEDEDNQDGLRPETVEVQLLANGEAVGEPLVLGTDGVWDGEWTDLPATDETGTEITYTVAEVDVPEGYESKITGDAEQGFTITNTHEPETTSISVAKVWDDSEDEDGLRPLTVSVQLMANGEPALDAEGNEVVMELSADSGWEASFDDVPVYADGEAIVYAVEELDVPEDYEPAVEGDAEQGFTITNFHEPTGEDVTPDDPTPDDKPDPDDKPTPTPTPTPDDKPTPEPKPTPTPKPDSKPKVVPKTSDGTVQAPLALVVVATLAIAAGAHMKRREN